MLGCGLPTHIKAIFYFILFYLYRIQVNLCYKGMNGEHR